jgi:hypothetical protein
VRVTGTNFVRLTGRLDRAEDKSGRVIIWWEKEHGGNVPYNKRQHQDVQPDTHTQVVAHRTCLAGTR